MKVYYVNSGLQGCYMVRCLLPLMANGYDGDQTSIRIGVNTPENKAQAAQDADVVVFHRPEDPKRLEMARHLKQTYGKKIVFDNDDTYKDDGGFKYNDLMNKERVQKGLGTLNQTIDSFIKEADLVTCSTEYLKKEYEKINPNVVVLPNCVDPFYFDAPLRNEGDEVRIGIVGSIAVTADMEICEPIVKHFHDKPGVKIVLFSMPPQNHDKVTRELYQHEYAFWESVNVEWQPFVDMENYYDTLNNLKLDMMIIPRSDTYYTRCKSNIKFLEASMFEIPVIAQGLPDGMSPYEVNPEDAKHMIIVKDNTQWIPEIQKLIDDKPRRLEMGKKAHEYVLENYDIETKGHLWEEAYKTLFDAE